MFPANEGSWCGKPALYWPGAFAGQLIEDTRRCVMAVITFSRQYGSRGDEVAARVREMLGYRLFNKRMMV